MDRCEQLEALEQRVDLTNKGRAAAQLVGRLVQHFRLPTQVSISDLASAWGPQLEDLEAFEADSLANLIIRTRKSPWMPTIGEVLSYRRSTAEATQMASAWASTVLKENKRRLAPEPWADEEWTWNEAADAASELLSIRARSVLIGAYLAGFVDAGKSGGVSPSDLERMGKHLIAAAREAA